MKQDYDMVWNGYTLCPENWGMTNVSEVFHRIYYVYGGEACCKYKNQTFCLEPGKLYLFPVMYPYTMWHNPENPLDVLWFHIEMDIQLCQDVVCMEIEQDSLYAHLLEVMRTLSNKPKYYEELLKVFDVFLYTLSEELHINPYTEKKMTEVLEYIDQNIGQDLSVNVLADQAGMERSYFSRKFKSVFHMTPNQYITAKRMKVAARELSAGASVYHSARAAGYTDEKAFSRAFKRYMEMSPGKYRESHIIQP